MISITADQLFLISEIQWQQNLCHIDPKFLTARFVASPGFHVCLPRWCWKQDCERWLSKTGALPIAEFELTDELRERVDDHGFDASRALKNEQESKKGNRHNEGQRVCSRCYRDCRILCG